MHQRFFRLLLLLVFGLPGFVRPASAQATVEVREAEVIYQFGGEMRFSAAVETSAEVQKVTLFFQPEGIVETHVIEATLAGDNLQASISIKDYPLRPFSEVAYWYQFELENGETAGSPHLWFVYEDNRFDWQDLDNEFIQVHWYNGDLAFGQEILNVAEAGIQRIQEMLPGDPDEIIDIYVYSSPEEVQSALSLSGMSWVAGHATPDLGVVLVSLPPGPDQHLEMERQVPHELMHVRLYQVTREGNQYLPVWLQEGMASMAELYPHPDYDLILDSAYRKNSLLPLTDLCQGFPQDSSGALLAYAQSASFVQYIHQIHGKPGLQRLIAQYVTGQDCQQGIQNALQTDLTRLEGEWRRTVFAGYAWYSRLNDLLAWLVVLAVVILPPLSLSALSLRSRKNGS